MLHKAFLNGGPVVDNLELLNVTEFELSLIFFFLLIRLESSMEVSISTRASVAKRPLTRKIYCLLCTSLFDNPCLIMR